MTVRVLSFHAPYRCRDSGVCCSSGWPIPVEADRLLALKAALATQRLQIAGSGRAFEAPADAPPETPAILATHDSHCVFHLAGGCAIHRALGHSALPLACRQFPRVSVIDPRGVSVTLSHYCPTAAGLLCDAGNDDNDVNDINDVILVNTARFPPTGEYVGLDARAALPPLLRPGMLMDWESWWLVEAMALETLLHRGDDAGSALALVRAAVAEIQTWRPGGTALVHCVTAAFGSVTPLPQTSDPEALIQAALATVPDPFRASAAW